MAAVTSRREQLLRRALQEPTRSLSMIACLARQHPPTPGGGEPITPLLAIRFRRWGKDDSSTTPTHRPPERGPVFASERANSRPWQRGTDKTILGIHRVVYVVNTATDYHVEGALK